jgi:predicted O-methyltransferase YrrM
VKRPTGRVDISEEPQALLADAIVEVAGRRSTHQRLLEVWRNIHADKYLSETMKALRGAVENDRSYWDMCCALAAYTSLHSPTRYLEIGVRQGRSAVIVAAVNPDVDLYLFDTWHRDYAGVPNPGPDFVRQQLGRVNHRGHAYFVTGRSQETLPAFFANDESPQTFPLITVDGDHRDEGARADLANVIGHLSPGGMIAFDDIAHPDYPTLHRTWQEFVDAHPDLIVRTNTSDATGTAIALSPPNHG